MKLDALMRRPVRLVDAVSIAQASGERARIRLIGEREAFRTKEGEPLGRIAIPKIKVKYAFLQGTADDTLKRGPGHYAGTAMPGQDDTVGIAGHRTTYDAPFRNLDKLDKGDPIVLTMPYGTFTYRVTGHRIVKPQDTSVLRPRRPRQARAHRLLAALQLRGAHRRQREARSGRARHPAPGSAPTAGSSPACPR